MLDGTAGFDAQPKASIKRAETRKQEREAGRRSGPQRTAAAALPAESTAPVTTTPPPAPQEDRMRVLGLPLPTGREIKECLFSFRC
jgi:hypothetical protein